MLWSGWHNVPPTAKMRNNRKMNSSFSSSNKCAFTDSGFTSRSRRRSPVDTPSCDSSKQPPILPVGPTMPDSACNMRSKKVMLRTPVRSLAVSTSGGKFASPDSCNIIIFLKYNAKLECKKMQLDLTYFQQSIDCFAGQKFFQYVLRVISANTTVNSKLSDLQFPV